MLKNFVLATAVATGLLGAGTFSVASADETEATAPSALDLQVTAVEALVIQYQDDAAGLQAAVEQLVINAADPELAAGAVLVVFDNSQNPAIRAILARNTSLKDAAGRGLGAAIAQIGVTNPDLATRMSAQVAADGSADMVASVETGTNERTASIATSNQENGDSQNDQDNTPENVSSDS